MHSALLLVDREGACSHSASGIPNRASFNKSDKSGQNPPSKPNSGREATNDQWCFFNRCRILATKELSDFGADSSNIPNSGGVQLNLFGQLSL